MSRIFFYLLTVIITCGQVFSFEIEKRSVNKAPQGGEVKISVLETTDVHGNIFPYDYFRGRDDERGLLKIAALVKEKRAENPNTILLDCGDLIQGSPLTFLYNQKNTDVPNPMILALNEMRYDAFAVGNHDIEQGKPVFDRCREESEFPWLAANCVREDGKTYFDPYVVLEVGGVRIGILGMCTPGVPLWVNEDLYPGMEFRDMVDTAEKWVPILLKEEKVDLLIGLFHAGINVEYDREVAARQGVPPPNAAGLVAEACPQFDVILTGHAHQLIPSNRHPEDEINGVKILQAGRWAFNLGIVDVVIKEADGRWVVSSIDVRNENVEGTPPDGELQAKLLPYHEKTLTYTEQVVGELEVPLSGRTALVDDTPLLDLVNRVQQWASGADISFASCFNTYLSIPAGGITVRDIYGIYRYENFLSKVEMTGRQIDSYLEYSANYFARYPFDSGQLYDDNIRHYNVEAASGIEYVIDISQPKDQRVEIFKMSDGRAFHVDSTYSVAMNSYRAAGGGGFLSAAGADEAQSVWMSAVDMRELIIAYFAESKKTSVGCDNNWKIIPDDAEKILLESVNR